ncbi:MAG: hypothetical protein RLZZ223_473 [Candidatus Parcubacteria bacterium]|jgi:PAS domain S-box-containing protein
MKNNNDLKIKKTVIKSGMFRVFTALIFSFTVIIYIIVFVIWYLKYNANLDTIYTEGFTNVLILFILILFVFGWIFLYGVYMGVVRPSYETFNIIFQIVSGLSVDEYSSDQSQLKYLQDFMNSTLKQLENASLMRKIDISTDTEIYIKKLKHLTEQNKSLLESKKNLSQLVDRLEKQQKLLELEKAKTSAIIDAIPNGLVASSRDGNIFLVNQESERLLGVNADNLLGKFIYQVLPSTTEDELDIKSSNNKIRNTRVFDYESPDSKNKISIENTANPIVLNGEVVGVVDVLRDKTQEHSTERAQKEFVSIASHQLRTPITSIKWNAELVLSNPNLDKDVRAAVDDIYKSNDRMEKLVNALLNLSRIDLGKIKFVKQEINLDKYITSLIKSLDNDIIRKNITIEKDIKFDKPIINDPVYIDIIVGNVLSNAVKYTANNGKIKLKVSNCQSKDCILLEISDNGLGIPKSQQSHIFGRLFRADNAKNTDTDGNGLGLYVVKKLIESMKGNVWFESQENKGTTFFLEIPIVLDDTNVI